jgi:protein Tob/BTG
MKDEVESAANFMVSFMRGLSEDQKETYRRTLVEALCRRYENHWFPNKPIKGTAYRCVRVGPSITPDPMLLSVANSCELSDIQIANMFPTEITIWVDPHEVSYRIGEEGSVGIYFEGKPCPVNAAQSSTNTSCSSRSCRNEVRVPAHYSQTWLESRCPAVDHSFAFYSTAPIPA